MLLLGWISALPQKLAEDCSIIVALAGGYIPVAFSCHRQEVHKSTCRHGPDPRCLDERYIRSEVMVYRKLDKISREMGAAANEDLWFRKMGGVRACTSGFRKGGGASDAREEWPTMEKRKRLGHVRQ